MVCVYEASITNGGLKAPLMELPDNNIRCDLMRMASLMETADRLIQKAFESKQDACSSSAFFGDSSGNCFKKVDALQPVLREQAIFRSLFSHDIAVIDQLYATHQEEEATRYFERSLDAFADRFSLYMDLLSGLETLTCEADEQGGN